MTTIYATIEAARELANGEKRPNLKLALYAAAMSPLQSLYKNGLQTRILARYIDKPLPEREQLYRELMNAKGNINNNHIKALYRIEELDRSGILDLFTDIGEDYPSQCVWREKLLSYLKGYGMGRKTISFALLIYSPLTCQLVPIDRHVLKRLGYDFAGIPAYNKNLYLAIESRVATERAESGHDVALGIWHWYKWEEWRVTTGDSKGKGEVESHKLLSCRQY